MVFPGKCKFCGLRELFFKATHLDKKGENLN